MVRFSDMLGGSGESDDADASESPYAALASDEADAETDEDSGERTDANPEKEPVPMSTFESPEAVLNRLTQYATSRPDPVAPPVEPPAAVESPPLEPSAVEPPPAEPATVEPLPEPDDPLAPVGDDFLPSARGVIRRSGRGRKRHP